MSNRINIKDHEFIKTQIGANIYKISAFYEQKNAFNFNVSLQPPNKEGNLPSYQLINKYENIPHWTKNSLNIISDWIIDIG